MHLCYIDESGTSSIPGNTDHFVLAGISIPIWHWPDCEREISAIKTRYHLRDAEIHTAWIMRRYLEQSRIQGFDGLSHQQRRTSVEQYRNGELIRLQRSGRIKQYRQTKKNYIKTNAYIHLNHFERSSFILDVAKCVARWGFARLFAECINKVYFDPHRSRETIDEQSFSQIVSRFEQYLQNVSQPDNKFYGLLIHDNNQTIARKHTRLMKDFHANGTLWTHINHIIETPLFVDSELTSLVQIADLCSYALRRYLENNESVLFEEVFKRADRKNGVVVGVRHWADLSCGCVICRAHQQCPV